MMAEGRDVPVMRTLLLSELVLISCLRHVYVFLPSLYIKGMNSPNIPRRQYAWVSTFLVWQPSAHYKCLVI